MQQARKKNEWYYEAGEWVTSSNKLLHEFTQFKSQNKGKKTKRIGSLCWANSSEYNTAPARRREREKNSIELNIPTA